VGTAGSARAAVNYSAQIRAIAVTSVTARAPVCRGASKAASQARWLAKPENQGYFRGPENVARVQLWRSRHPGYWRGGRPSGTALQEVSVAQPLVSKDKTDDMARSPLQEVLTAQPAVLIGLIAHIVGTPLQDDIVRATGAGGRRFLSKNRRCSGIAGRLLRLGQDILSLSAAGGGNARARRRSRP
jgi:hypothetical protein